MSLGKKEDRDSLGPKKKGINLVLHKYVSHRFGVGFRTYVLFSLICVEMTEDGERTGVI